MKFVSIIFICLAISACDPATLARVADVSITVGKVTAAAGERVLACKNAFGRVEAFVNSASKGEVSVQYARAKALEVAGNFENRPCFKRLIAKRSELDARAALDASGAVPSKPTNMEVF